MGVFEDVRQRDTRGLEHQRFRFRSQRQSRCNVQIHVDARGRECGHQVGKNRNKVGASLVVPLAHPIDRRRSSAGWYRASCA